MTTLGLCLITRNEERRLARCLKGIAPYVDRMYVGDIGSEDATAEVAEQMGAEVVRVQWREDFADARNQVLRAMDTDWVVVLNVDEVIDSYQGVQLRDYIRFRSADAYWLSLRRYVHALTDRVNGQLARWNDSDFSIAREFPAYVAQSEVRLFRRSLEFSGRAAETIEPSIRTAASLHRSELHIHSFRHVEEAALRHRDEIVRRSLLQLAVQEDPNDAARQLALGILELEAFNDAAAALSHLQQATCVQPENGVAWMFTASCHLKLGDARSALDGLKHAELSGEHSDFAAEIAGDAHYLLGEYALARDSYRRAARRREGGVAVCKRISGELRSKLGLAEVRTGIVDGLKKIESEVKHTPSNAMMHRHLIEALVVLERYSAAATAAEELLRCARADANDYVAAARLRQQIKQHEQAEALLIQAGAAFPNHPALGSALAELCPQRFADPASITQNLG